MIDKNIIKYLQKSGFIEDTSCSNDDQTYLLKGNFTTKRCRIKGERTSHTPIVKIDLWKFIYGLKSCKFEVVADLDQIKFMKNLETVSNDHFGKRTDIAVVFRSDRKFSLISKHSRLSSLEQKRGYNNLSRQWNNPDGIFSVNFEIAINFDHISIYFSDYFILGFVDSCAVKSLFTAIISSFGLGGNRAAKILDSANIFELKIPVIDILLTSLHCNEATRSSLSTFFGEIVAKTKTLQFGFRNVDKDFRLKFGTLEDSNNYIWNGDTPIQVLEARQSEQILYEIDKEIINGNQNTEIIGKFSKSHYYSDGFLYRVYLLVLLREQHTRFYPYLLRPIGEMIFESYQVFRNDGGDVLEMSTNLFEKFSKCFGPIDNHSMVSGTFSEYMGDVWLNHCDSKSRIAYERAIDIFGENIRLYQKLLDVILKENNENEIISHLNKMIDLESRNSQKSKYCYQLSKMLFNKEDMHNGLIYLRRAYTLNRTDHNILYDLVDNLEHDGKYSELISLIDDHLRIHDGKISKKSLSKILIKEALVWINHLNRIELGLSKLIKAESLDHSNIDLKILIAENYKNMNMVYESGVFYEKALTLAEEQEDTTLINSINAGMSAIFGVRQNLRCNMTIVNNWNECRSRDKGISLFVEKATSLEVIHTFCSEFLLCNISTQQDTQDIDELSILLFRKYGVNSTSSLLFKFLQNKGYCSDDAFTYLTEFIDDGDDPSFWSDLYKTRLLNLDGSERMLEFIDNVFANIEKFDTEFLIDITLSIVDLDSVDVHSTSIEKFLDNILFNYDLKNFNYMLSSLESMSISSKCKESFFDLILQSLVKHSFQIPDRSFDSLILSLAADRQDIANEASKLLIKYSNHLSNQGQKNILKLLLEDQTLELDHRLMKIDFSFDDKNFENILYHRFFDSTDKVEDKIVFLGRISERYLNYERLVNIIFEKISQDPENLGIEHRFIFEKFAKEYGGMLSFEFYTFFWIRQDIDESVKADLLERVFKLWDECYSYDSLFDKLLDCLVDANKRIFAISKIFFSLENSDIQNREGFLKRFLMSDFIEYDDYKQYVERFKWAARILFEFVVDRVGKIDSVQSLKKFLKAFASGLILFGNAISKKLVELLTSYIPSIDDETAIFFFKVLCDHKKLNLDESDLYRMIRNFSEADKSSFIYKWDSTLKILEENTDGDLFLKEQLIVLGLQCGFPQNICMRTISSIRINSSQRNLVLKYTLLRRSGRDQDRFLFLNEYFELVVKSAVTDQLFSFSEMEIYNDFDFLKKMFGDHPTSDAVRANKIKDRADYFDDVNDNSLQGENNIFDWRKKIDDEEFSREDIDILYESRNTTLDKHIGIQYMALRSGEISCLRDWGMPVWLGLKNANYNFNTKDRFPIECIDDSILSKKSKIITSLHSFFVRCFVSKISLLNIANHRGITELEVRSSRVMKFWDRGILGKSGISVIDKNFSDRYKAYSLDDLGENVFYDVQDGAFYFDEKYYEKAPISHLTFRILEIYWSIKLRYFAFFQCYMDADFEISLAALRATLFNNKKILSDFPDRFRESAEIFLRKTYDRNKLKGDLESISGLDRNEISDLVDSFRLHLHKVMLTQTLDLVGLIQYLANKDLISDLVRLPSQFWQDRTYRNLFNFVSKISLPNVTDLCRENACELISSTDAS